MTSFITCLFSDTLYIRCINCSFTLHLGIVSFVYLFICSCSSVCCTERDAVSRELSEDVLAAAPASVSRCEAERGGVSRRRRCAKPKPAESPLFFS